MNRGEHCNRLGVSLARVEALMCKRNLSFEDAVKVPVERVIKHNINGITKRNTEWYKQYSIPARNANSWLSRVTNSRTKRTLRDVLEKYGVDTTSMEIYPCDGEVVMITNPI